MGKCCDKTGKERSVFSNREEALKTADYEKREHGVEFYPYKCDKCGYWHLAPAGRKVNFRENACGCKDSSGVRGKRLYDSKEDAERAAMTVREGGRGTMHVYPCPEGSGWHLTHKF